VNVQYRRGKTVGTAIVTLTNREGTTELLKRNIYASKSLGADLESLSKVERDRFKVEGGVRISKLYANGLLRRLGLTEGYTISAINQEACREPQDVERLLIGTRGRIVLEGYDPSGRPSYYSFGY
jgi:serine protease Do